MKAHQPALLVYLQTYRPDLADAFSKGMMGRQFYTSPKRGGGSCVDPTKDGGGHSFSEGHSFYELSQVIQDFQLGRRTCLDALVNQNIDNFEKHFREKGPHYCAGYLSRFGNVARDPVDEYEFCRWLPRWLGKRREKEAYNAAVKAWQEFLHQ